MSSFCISAKVVRLDLEETPANPSLVFFWSCVHDISLAGVLFLKNT